MKRSAKCQGLEDTWHLRVHRWAWTFYVLKGYLDVLAHAVCVKSLCWACVWPLYSVWHIFFFFPSPVRAPIPSGRTSVPKPRNCTLNSGENRCNTCHVELKYFCFVWSPLFRLTYWLSVAQMVPRRHWEVSTFFWFHRTTILAAVAFLDAFQKVADMATSSRGKMRRSHIYILLRQHFENKTVKNTNPTKGGTKHLVNAFKITFILQLPVFMSRANHGIQTHSSIHCSSRFTIHHFDS